MVNGLRPSHWSPPVPRTHRISRALQHGKAFTGCATPLSPSCCTRSVLIDIAACDRLPKQRVASKWCALLTGAGRVHGLAGPVASRSGEVHADAVQRGFWCCLPSVHRGECASQGARAAGCRGRDRPPGASPSLLESAQATLWSVQCRFGAEDCMRRLCGTPPAGWVLHPRTGPSRARRGAESAVFRPPRGRGRANPRPARAPGYPFRSSRLGLGHWTWLYGEFRLITVRCAKSEHLCPIYSHN